MSNSGYLAAEELARHFRKRDDFAVLVHEWQHGPWGRSRRDTRVLQVGVGAEGYRVTLDNLVGKEHSMPKGEQRSNKMTKKPKKDRSPPKESPTTSTRPVPPVTTVLPKGKLKNK